MATNPTEIQKIEADIKAVYTFGVSHLVLIALLAGAICASIYMYDSRRADKADAIAATQTAIAQVIDRQNTVTQQQNQQTLASLAQANQTLQQEVASLLAAQATRNTQLAQTQVVIKTLAPPALSAKWGDLANEPVPVIDSTGNFLVPLPLAIKSVDALVTVPVLEANATSNKTIIDKQTTEIANDIAALDSEEKAHASDTKACVADKAALSADIKKAQADARKSKFKWFGAGFVLGLLTGHAAGF